MSSYQDNFLVLSLRIINHALQKTLIKFTEEHHQFYYAIFYWYSRLCFNNSVHEHQCNVQMKQYWANRQYPILMKDQNMREIAQDHYNWTFYKIVSIKNSKWVWSGNTTITNCRQPRGTARKSRLTITRHQEDKLSKTIISLPHQDDCNTRMDIK